MTSTMVAIIGARRGPKEGTCNEGAHYQWLTASTTSWNWSCRELQRAFLGIPSWDSCRWGSYFGPT